MAAGHVVYGTLSGNGTITGLVGGKIYPMIAPQNTAFPYIIYSQISLTPSDTKSGVSKMDFSRVQIDVYAETYASVVSISDAVRTALDRLTPGTVSGVVTDGVSFLSETDMYEEDFEVYRKSIDYQIRIKL